MITVAKQKVNTRNVQMFEKVIDCFWIRIWVDYRQSAAKEFGALWMFTQPPSYQSLSQRRKRLNGHDDQCEINRFHSAGKG